MSCIETLDMYSGLYLNFSQSVHVVYFPEYHTEFIVFEYVLLLEAQVCLFYATYTI